MNFVAQHDEQTSEVEVERSGSGYRVRLDDRWIQADLVSAGGYVRSLRLEDGTQFSLIHHREGNMHEVTLAGSNVRVEIIDPLALRRRREDDAGSGSRPRDRRPYLGIAHAPVDGEDDLGALVVSGDVSRLGGRRLRARRCPS